MGEPQERVLTKFDVVMGVLGTLFMGGLYVYVIVKLIAYFTFEFSTYLQRGRLVDRAFQLLATCFLALVALVIPELRSKYPRLYYGIGVMAGVAAIWIACDQVGARLHAANTANIGTAEMGVLLAGMFVFAKSVEAWRARPHAARATAPSEAP